MLKPDTLALTACLALLTALGPLSTDMYLPSLPAIAGELGAGTSGAQLTLSAFLLGFAAGQAVYGPVSDRYGRKPALLAGLAIYVAASVACALAPTVGWLVLARVAQALGAAGPIVLARAVVRDLYDGARAGRELARMGTIMGVVPALAPILGGLVHEVAGWRFTFTIMVAFGLALAAVVAARLPETTRERARAPLSVGAVLGGFGALLAHPAYRAYVALAALAYAGMFAFVSGSSFVLQGVYGLAPVPYGFSFTLAVLGYISGTLGAQRLVSRRGLDAAIAAGVSAMAAGGTTMLALVGSGVPSSLAVTLPMAVFAAGVGLAMPQTVAAAMAPFPDRAGAASSLLGITQTSLGALVGVGVAAALRGSALPLPLAVGGIGLLALGVLVATRRARRG